MRMLLRRKLDHDADKYNDLLHMVFKQTHDIRMMAAASRYKLT